MEKLKPCPFCGGEAEICSAFENKFLGKYWYVRCKTCYSRGTGMYESGKELAPNEEYEAIMGAWERAIEAWNRRAEPCRGEEDEIVVMFCNPHDAVEFLGGEDAEKIENCICMSPLIPEGEVTLVPKAEFLDWLKGKGKEHGQTD